MARNRGLLVRGSILLATILFGCTSMPPKYTKGDPTPWPRWGYQVTNETPEGLDLEVIFFQYVMFCTAADGQLEKAREVFLWCAADIAKKRGRTIEPVPVIELQASHIRNTVDGVCTVRVGKRLRFSGAAVAPPERAARATPTSFPWLRRR